MQKYKAIFFDWDGTAVVSRKANAQQALQAMSELLLRGTKLIVVSGTTYNNLCDGKMHEFLPKEALANLHFGLARGNYNYGFDGEGALQIVQDCTPDIAKTVLLHDAVLALHNKLLARYNLQTDVVFSRPGYCKVDLMVDCLRSSEALFMQDSEVLSVLKMLKDHKIDGGFEGLIQMACEIGADKGLKLKVTTDAKYLEVGFTTKSDNVDYFMSLLQNEGIDASDCCFWGDEFGAIAPGIWGSDAQMITDKTQSCDFYNVSDINLPMPKNVKTVSGGVPSFLEFLRLQNEV